MNQPRAKSTNILKSGIVIVLAGALAVAATGCAEESPSTKPSASSAKTSSPTATKKSDAAVSTPTPSQSTIAISGVPVELNCEQIMSTKTLYEYNPNFAFVPDQAPVGGTQAEKIVALKGVTCQYVNLSGGATVNVSVAKLTPGGSALLTKELNAASSPVNTFGAQPDVYGYYSSPNGIGTAQAIKGDYWVAVESSWFTSPDDATDFMRSALNAVK